MMPKSWTYAPKFVRGLSFGMFCATLSYACKTNNFNGGGRQDADRPLQNKVFEQVTREQRSVNLIQGRSGAKNNESYAVTASGILDLLVVVDTSSSMSEEQDNLSQRMVPLLSAVSNSDWQIAVTTTDPSDDCITSLIKKNDFFPETRFKRAINAGINGTGVERPIYRAVEALKPSCKSWLRPGSSLAVLIITDEDNCHIDAANGYGCNGQADLKGSYLTDYLRSIRSVGSDARVYGLLWHPSQAQSSCSSALKQANIIAEVITATNGTWGSICDSNYSQTLTTISSNVATILKSDIVLKSVPDAGTFKMTVNGQNWTDYTLNGTVVKFTRTPPAGPVVVSYVSGAGGVVTNAFDLPSTPLAGSISATVGTNTVAGTWDASRSKMVLPLTPPEGSTFTVKYKDDSVLKDSFVIASDADRSTIEATINGTKVSQSDFTFDASTGAVKFKTPPPEAAKINITWRGSQASS